MITPFGFIQTPSGGGGGLPVITQNFSFFYDAGESTTWDDQSGNGNNGTESTAGSGGSSSITHVAGATPYWQLLAPSPTSEQPYVDSGVAPGNLGDTTEFCMFTVFRDPDLTVNMPLLEAVDGSGDQLSLGTSRTTNKIFCNLRGGTNRQVVSSNPILENVWHMVVVQFDGVDYRMYINNVDSGNDPKTTINISANLEVGRNALSSTTVSEGDVAVAGWMTGQSLTSDDRQALYDYYNAIYSF